MSNQDDAPPEGADEPTEEFDLARAKAKIAKANTEAANLRKRVKELEAAEAKLRDLEDANKSEQQKLAERAEAAERKLAEAEARILRMEVAAAKGLSPSQAKRLVGATREELESDADELLADFGGASDDDGAGKQKPASKPVESLRGGTDPTGDVTETNPRKLAELIPRI